MSDYLTYTTNPERELEKLRNTLPTPYEILSKNIDNLPTDIPSDLNTFYKNMGYFTHSKTQEPVTALAPHQHEAWEDSKLSNYRLYLKSQKIGLSTLLLLEDIHIALTRGRGQEILVISQSKEKAQDHLQDIRKMLRESPVYSDYIIEIGNKNKHEPLLSDEKTKVEIIYIRNPDNPARPTKIIARGITSPGSLISYKKVCHIHMSDITLADMVEERFNESFGGAFSRLANTEGTMVIECPPRGPSGPVYDIVNEDDTLKDEEGIIVELQEGKVVVTSQGFLVRRYTYHVGLKCGLITENFIKKEKSRLGVLFGMYYEADFYTSDKTWFNPEQIKQISTTSTDIYGMYDEQ